MGPARTRLRSAMAPHSLCGAVGLLVLALADGQEAGQASGLRAWASAAPIELIDPSEEDDVAQLRKQLKEEITRAQIADVATRSALLNATLEARRRKKAEDALAQSEPRFRATEEARDEAEAKVKDLQEQLAAAKQRSADAKAKLAKAEAATAEAKKAAEDAEAQAAWEGAQVHELPKVTLGGVWSFGQWLKTEKDQTLIALTAGFVGLLSMLDPALFLKVLSIGTFALLVGVALSSQADAYWGSEVPGFLDVLTGSELSVIAGLAAYLGFDGFLLVIGAAFGLLVSVFMTSLGVFFGWDSPVGLVLYGSTMAVGAVACAVTKEQGCGALGPMVGGLLFGSCVSFCIAGEGAVPSWLDSVSFLVSGQSHGPAWQAYVAGLLLWAAVAGVGISRFFYKFPSLPFDNESEADSETREPLLKVEPDSPERGGRSGSMAPPARPGSIRPGPPGSASRRPPSRSGR